jgi:hypothetical protein
MLRNNENLFTVPTPSPKPMILCKGTSADSYSQSFETSLSSFYLLLGTSR